MYHDITISDLYFAFLAAVCTFLLIKIFLKQASSLVPFAIKFTAWQIMGITTWLQSVLAFLKAFFLFVYTWIAPAPIISSDFNGPRG